MNIALMILANHYIADFLMQSDEMALNKSSSNKWLLIHIFYYVLGLTYISGVYIVFTLRDTGLHAAAVLMGWLLSNAILHFITDYCFSRLTTYLYKKNMRHWFFCAIGLDQLIHYFCLLLTWEWLVK